MIRPSLSAVAAAATTCLLLPASAWAAEGTTTTPAKGEDTPIRVPADEAAETASATSGGSLVRTFVGLAIVLAVIYGLYWVLRQIKASREEATKGDGLATVASIGLGPSRSLHLIRAGQDYLLVGVGEHAITPLRTYTLAEAVVAGLVPDPDDDAAGVVEGTAREPATVAAGLLAKVTGGARSRPARPAQQVTLQAFVGQLREKTVRS